MGKSKNAIFLLIVTVLVVFLTGVELNTSEAWAKSKEGKSKTLEKVLNRGEVWVGVSNLDMPGFFEWQGSVGLEADLARALATAIFADADKVKFIGVSAAERFTALQDERYDVLVRVSTFTLARDATLSLNFCPTYFYDGQGIMTSAEKSLEDVESIGVIENTYHYDNLLKFMAQQGLSFVVIQYSSESEMLEDYEEGSLEALSSDKSFLYSYQSSLDEPGDHIIFDEMLSKEPLSPVVRHGDDEWYDIVKWVIYALFEAEELEINSNNVDWEKQSSADPTVRRFLSVEGTLCQDLGLPNDCFYQTIRQVGNYKEIYEDNIEFLPRGLNSLYTEGGLFYSPPMK
jgi:general L-amino acid transport system substrate-binding protein